MDLKELKELNKQYLDLEQQLESIKNEVKNKEKRIEILREELTLAEGREITARRSGNTNSESIAKADKEEISKKIKAAEEELESIEAEGKGISSKIEAIKDQIKETPEARKHLEEVTRKKFSRQIDPLKKEKKELEDKKTKLEEIKQLATHNTLGNNLRGMLVASNTIRVAKKELESLEINNNGNITYTDPDKAKELEARISDAETKLSTNRGNLQRYIEDPKNKCNINMQDIDELVSNNECYVIKNNGEINLDETIGKNIRQVNAQIKGKNKQIRTYEIGVDQNRGNIPSEVEYNKPQDKAEDKIKWYQFGKRFKNWWNKRKQPALGESKEEATAGETEISQSGTEIETKEETKENSFRDALQFKVFQDVRAEYEGDALKKAKQTRKAEEALKRAEQTEEEEERQ